MKLNDEYFVKALFGTAQINQHSEAGRVLIVTLNLLADLEERLEKLEDLNAKSTLNDNS